VSFPLTYPASTTGASAIIRWTSIGAMGGARASTARRLRISHAYGSAARSSSFVTGFDALGVHRLLRRTSVTVTPRVASRRHDFCDAQ
jgi:hypothetical protein